MSEEDQEDPSSWDEIQGGQRLKQLTEGGQEAEEEGLGLLRLDLPSLKRHHGRLEQGLHCGRQGVEGGLVQERRAVADKLDLGLNRRSKAGK